MCSRHQIVRPSSPWLTGTDTLLQRYCPLFWCSNWFLRITRLLLEQIIVILSLFRSSLSHSSPFHTLFSHFPFFFAFNLSPVPLRQVTYQSLVEVMRRPQRRPPRWPSRRSRTRARRTTTRSSLSSTQRCPQATATPACPTTPACQACPTPSSTAPLCSRWGFTSFVWVFTFFLITFMKLTRVCCPDTCTNAFCNMNC